MKSVLVSTILFLCFSCVSREKDILSNITCVIIEEIIPRRVPFISLPEEQANNITSKKLLLCNYMSYDFFSELDLDAYSFYLQESFEYEVKLERNNDAFIKEGEYCTSEFDVDILNKENYLRYREDDMQEALIDNNADAILLLSPPVISDDRSKYSILTFLYCGKLCASVEMLVFKKNESKWEVYARKNISLS